MGVGAAYLPDLPGVIGLGATREEVEARLAEALAAYAEVMSEDARPLPVPVSHSGTVTV